MSKYENELRTKLDAGGYVVIRSAGSMGEGDLVALKYHKVVGVEPKLMEVKKTKGKAVYIKGKQRTERQFEKMRNHAEKGIDVYYAIRFTRGDEETRWQFFKITANTEKYPIFRRGEGMKLDQILVE